jgi:hypothetical protein
MKEPDMASSTEEHTVLETEREVQMRTELRPEASKTVFEHFREYARERPGVVALYCFGLGFVVGWKLKPW